METVDLCDSDEEELDSAPQRKRLKSKRTVDEAPAPVVSAASILAPLADVQSPNKRQLPPSITQSSAPKASPKKAKAPASDSPAVASSGVRLPLDGMRVAVTGVMTVAGRARIEDMIGELGGKLAAAVSGKTSFLIAGDLLEDGRPVSEGSKHRAATDKGVPVLSEEVFLAKYTPAAPPVTAPASAMRPTASLQGGASLSALTPAAPPRTSSVVAVRGDDLWVDRHRPHTAADLVGHGELVRKLSDWLRGWAAVHVLKTAKPPAYSKENAGAKAALLSGPPGIGKSSLAGIVARQLGYEVLELNASDTRNKGQIDSKLMDAVSSRAISCTSSSSSSSSSSGSVLRNRLVIMDEVDGMGGADRGGMAELIKIIKLAKIPIIAICNDRMSAKVRSLANHCFDLRVKRPTKAQIAARLVAVAKQEGLAVDSNAAEMLAEQAGNDIRAAINALQMWRYSSQSLGYGDMKQGMARIEKDKVLRQTAFDSCLQILSGPKANWEERYNSFFIDYSLCPLLIQQNYIDAAKSGVFRQPQLDDASKMDALAAAADAVSDMDLVGARIRGQDQHWELLPTQAVFCLAVGQPIAGFQAFPAFPAWLGKYSTTNKTARLVRELVQHTSLSVGQGFTAMRLDYAPYLRTQLLQPLLAQGKEGVEQVLARLQHYGLTREDMMETLREMQFKGLDPAAADPFDRVDTATKTALTKAYNSSAHMSQTAVPELGSVKKGKRAAAGASEEVLAEEGEEALEAAQLAAEEDNGGGDEEDEDVEALKAKLANKRKGKAAAGGAGAAAKTKQTSSAAAAKKKK